jgi:heme A synthase
LLHEQSLEVGHVLDGAGILVVGDDENDVRLAISALGCPFWHPCYQASP